MIIKIKNNMCNHIKCVSDHGKNCYRLPFAIDGNDVIQITHTENGSIAELSIGIIRTCEYVPSVWFIPPTDENIELNLDQIRFDNLLDDPNVTP